MDRIARHWTNSKKKPAISNGFCTSLDCLGLGLGGGGGSRTRVRKSSAALSTHVSSVLIFALEGSRKQDPSVAILFYCFSPLSPQA